MAKLIARMFANAGDADAAVSELKSHGFVDGEMIIANPPNDGKNSLDGIVATMVGGYILRSLAAIYADGVAKGGHFVAVHAPFGGAKKATTILDSHNPIHSGVAEPVFPRPVWDEAAPLSSAFQLPALSSNPTPLSSFFSMNVLGGAGDWLSSLFGARTVAKGAAPLSSSIGLPILSKNPAPLSRLFRLPTLR